MPETVVGPEFKVWEVPGHAVRVEYSDSVMQQIRMEAVDGFHRVPHGGVETGGILFGTHQENLVRILAWRPIACEYATGPSFTLSDKDHAALAETLRSSSEDAELAGLEPAGWYHSHTRSEIFLSDADLEFFQRYFPEAWQLALVVRPASFAPTRAGFFFREADGSVHAETTYAEFRLIPSLPPELQDLEAQDQEPRDRRAQDDDEPQAALVAQPSVEAQVPVEMAPAFTGPSAEPAARPRRTRWKWYAAALIVIISAAATAAAIWMLEPANQRLALSATDAGGQLHIAWDRTASPIRDAAGGSLEIEDRGVRTEAKLTQAELRLGSISYVRQSGNIVVRLKVDQPGRAPVEEVTRFLKPDNATPSPAAPQADPAKEVMEHEAAAMRTRIEQQDAQLNKLQKIVGSTQQPSQPSVHPFSPPAASMQQRAVVPQTKTLDAPPPVAAVALTPPSAMATHVPNPAPVPARSAPLPSSGRIIWTGKFAKSGRLVIEGFHASTGVIVGALPAQTARVSAFPADLTAEGLTLFTADTKYTRPKTEAPGAANGWNRTTYMFDPKRSARVRVVENPGPKNGYRLLLESDTMKLGVVVIEWRAAE